MRYLCCLLVVVFVPSTVRAQQAKDKEAVPTLEPLARLGSSAFRQGEPVSAVCYSPDGATLASAGTSNTLYLWDAATGKLLARSLPGFAQAAPLEMAFSAGNKQLIAIGFTQLSVWDPTLKDPAAQLKAPSVLRALAVKPDGTVLTAGDDWFITHWDLKNAKPLRKFAKHQGAVTALALSRKGDIFFSASEDKTVLRWDLATGKSSAFLNKLSQPVGCLGRSTGIHGTTWPAPTPVRLTGPWCSSQKRDRSRLGSSRTVSRARPRVRPLCCTAARSGDAGNDRWPGGLPGTGMGGENRLHPRNSRGSVQGRQTVKRTKRIMGSGPIGSAG